MDGVNLWQLCDQLTVIQAALLVLNIDPRGIEHTVEQTPAKERPPGYDAIKAAIMHGLHRLELRGTVVRLRSPYEGVPLEEVPYCDGEPLTYDNFNVASSIVEVESLKAWLVTKKITSGFFFDKRSDIPGYLDPTNDHYSPKLAAAVKAWLALEGKKVEGMPEKQALENWLTTHADEFNLRDGSKLSKSGIKEAATVANWNTKGGAPKTPRRTPTRSQGI